MPLYTRNPGRAATLTVAASDASALSRAQADYVCDGTADEVQINAALAALPANGGMVLLSEGLFAVAAPVVVGADNVTLAGLGAGQAYNNSPSVKGGTLLQCSAGFTGAAVIVVQRSGSAQSLAGVHIRDLSINGASPGSGTFDGVYYEARKGSVRGLFIYRPRQHGMQFKSAVNEDCYDNVIHGNRVENALVDGYYFANRASDCLVRDNVAYNCTGNGMTFEDRAAAHMVSGNYLYSCGGAGVSAANTHQMKFLFNRLQDLNGGLYFTGNPSGSSGGLVIVGNTFRNCSKTTDNTTDAVNITMANATRGGVIASNDFYTNAGFDNGGTAPNKHRARYGINVASSNMTDLVIGPNTFGYDSAQAASAFGTGYVTDSGTTTYKADPQADMAWADGTDVAVGSTTGTKIGTATTQKLGFFNATPVVQPANTTDLRTILINLGLLASGGATPLDLNGGALTAQSATLSGLTSGRVPFATTAGLLTDDADLTFDGANLSVSSCVVPRILARSAVAAAHTGDTSETTLATVTVPAGAMGANGRIRVTTLWSVTNSANNKTLRVRFGGAAGTAFTNATITTQATHRHQTEWSNRNSASSQAGGPAAGTGGFGSATGALVTAAQNTANAVDIVISGQLANSGETVTLESYLVELLYGA
jgi:hypothetical protein